MYPLLRALPTRSAALEACRVKRLQGLDALVAAGVVATGAALNELVVDSAGELPRPLSKDILATYTP